MIGLGVPVRVLSMAQIYLFSYSLNIIFIYLKDFFTSALADGFSLESE